MTKSASYQRVVCFNGHCNALFARGLTLFSAWYVLTSFLVLLIGVVGILKSVACNTF